MEPRSVRPALVLAALTVAALHVPVEAQYFGRNKVQYRPFDFKIIRTEHFDVYYYPQEREAALDASRMVERSYARLSRILQHEFKERKPLIVYASHSDFQQTNALPTFIAEGTGGVTEALKKRMILPFTGSYKDFDHVLTHELVHGFQYDVIFSRAALSDASPAGARMPLWFMEGMAEYLSIGRIDPHTHSWLRDAVLSGYLRTIEQMMHRDDYLSYRFGQSLWWYIGSKWGDEVVGILLQRAPRVGLDRAFESTLGVSLDELSAEWTSAVRKEYLPQIADYDVPSAFAKKLTAHDRLEDPWFVAPAISPDGERMVFLSQRDGFSFDLFLADASTGEVHEKLIEAATNPDFESLRYMKSSAAFSPDGRYLAFAAQSGGRDALHIYDLERGEVTKELRFELNGVANPSWSPDGRRIVFTGMDGGLSDLFITDLEGRVLRLTQDRHADLLPAWSPDGRTIAFTTDRGPDMRLETLTYGNMCVALLDLTDGSIELLPYQDEGKNINAVWSPDSRSLVWVSDRTGTNDLYLFDRDEQQLHRLTTFLSGAIAITPLSPVLSWARDGRLLFTYFEKAGYNVYALDDPRALPRLPLPEPSRPVVARQEAGESRGASRDLAFDPASLVAPLDGHDTDNGNGSGDGSTARSAAPRGFGRSYYRKDDTFRRSDQPVEEKAPQAPVSVVALLDSAALALPDTSSFEHAPYRVKFTPDMVGRPNIGANVGGYYGNGVYGGSFIALSDMLGNHHILASANVNGSLSDARFYGGYRFLKTRANYGFAFAQTPLYRYFGAQYVPLEIDGQARDAVADIYRRDVIRSSQLAVAYPFNKFRRVEFGATGVYYTSDVLYRGVDRITGEPLRKDQSLGSMAYFEPSAALVFDNAQFGWTGPVLGRRYRLQVSQTFGDLDFTELLLDFRNYWNIERKVVLATRFIGLTRFGGDADRFAVYWGGPYYIRGYDRGSFDLDSEECRVSRHYSDEPSLSPCPVGDQLIGSSAAFMNLELRVPVISELKLGFLGNVPPVDAVAFFDGGLAWDSQICTATNPTRTTECAEGEPVRIVWQREADQDPYLWRQPLFSYGLGLRINIFYTVLRLDYAWPLNRPSRGGIFSLSFGPSF